MEKEYYPKNAYPRNDYRYARCDECGFINKFPMICIIGKTCFQCGGTLTLRRKQLPNGSYEVD